VNLYFITYQTSNNNTAHMFVLASTQDNAWAQCKVQDTTALSIETIDEQIQGIIVGS
jgi:hypothetical protein